MLFKKNIHFINIFCPKAIFHLREHEVLSKKKKRLPVFADYSFHITYQEKVLCLPRTSIKSTKMKSSNVRR